MGWKCMAEYGSGGFELPKAKAQEQASAPTLSDVIGVLQRVAENQQVISERMATLETDTAARFTRAEAVHAGETVDMGGKDALKVREPVLNTDLARLRANVEGKLPKHVEQGLTGVYKPIEGGPKHRYAKALMQAGGGAVLGNGETIAQATAKPTKGKANRKAELKAICEEHHYGPSLTKDVLGTMDKHYGQGGKLLSFRSAATVRVRCKS